MLRDLTPQTSRLAERQAVSRPPSRVAGKPGRVGAIVAFLGAVGLVLAYALPGATYDIVARQEYGIVLWLAIALGFATGLLPRSRPAPLVLALVGALAVFAAWTALSLLWTESAERTTAELARVLGYMALVVLLVCVLDRTTWRAAAMGLGFGALLVCGLAVASRLWPGAFPTDPLQQSGIARLVYPFGYWNAVGAWGAMSTAIGLAWSAHDQSRVRRAVALGFVPLAVLTTYLSYSRAGIAGTVLGVIAVLALSRHRVTAFLHAAAAAAGTAIAVIAVRGAPAIADGTGTAGVRLVLGAIAFAVAIGVGAAVVTSIGRVTRARTPARVVRLVVVVGLVVLAFTAAAFGPRLASRAWNEFRHPVVATTSDPASRLTQLSGTRYGVWNSALTAFSASPITGRGAGTFEFWWDRHPRSPEFVRNAHSFELENMAELGAPGLIFIVAVMAAALSVLIAVRRRTRRSTSVGASVALLAPFLVYLLQASVDWMWQVTAVTVLAFAGAAIAGVRLSASRPRLRWFSRGAIALAAVGAGLVLVPGLVSTAEIRQSQGAERAGNGPLALSWARAAVRAEPWAASPYEQRGLVLESAGRFTQAAGDLERAIAREPTNFRHWLILARIETERGDLIGATRDYNRARQLRPEAFTVG